MANFFKKKGGGQVTTSAIQMTDVSANMALVGARNLFFRSIFLHSLKQPWLNQTLTLKKSLKFRVNLLEGW